LKYGPNRFFRKYTATAALAVQFRKSYFLFAEENARKAKSSLANIAVISHTVMAKLLSIPINLIVADTQSVSGSEMIRNHSGDATEPRRTSIKNHFAINNFNLKKCLLFGFIILDYLSQFVRMKNSKRLFVVLVFVFPIKKNSVLMYFKNLKRLYIVSCQMDSIRGRSDMILETTQPLKLQSSISWQSQLTIHV
jgi:hypothetical protein